ncbi:unnamed protein product [Diamesa hyperborea]
MKIVFILFALIAVGQCRLPQHPVVDRIFKNFDKTIVDYRTEIERLCPTLSKPFGSELALFNNDIKTGLVGFLEIAVKLTTKILGLTAVDLINFIADLGVGATEIMALLEKYLSQASIDDFINSNCNDLKGVFVNQMTEVRIACGAVIAKDPLTMPCIERVLLGISPAVTIITNAIRTAMGNAVQKYTVDSRNLHTNIKGNVSIYTKAFETCIAKTPVSAVELCVDEILTNKGSTIKESFNDFAGDMGMMLSRIFGDLNNQTTIAHAGLDKEKYSLVSKVNECSNIK